MNEDDLSFYRRRLEEEQTRERQAATPEAASTHRLLAEIYTQRLEEFGTSEAEQGMFRNDRQRTEVSEKTQRQRNSLKT